MRAVWQTGRCTPRPPVQACNWASSCASLRSESSSASDKAAREGNLAAVSSRLRSAARRGLVRYLTNPSLAIGLRLDAGLSVSLVRPAALSPRAPRRGVRGIPCLAPRLSPLFPRPSPLISRRSSLDSLLPPAPSSFGGTADQPPRPSSEVFADPPFCNCSAQNNLQIGGST